MNKPNLKIWTKGDILGLVQDSDVAAMRAVCALFCRQDDDEKLAEEAKRLNFRGFSAATAKVGSELALWMTGGELDGVMRRRVGGKFGQWIHTGVRGNGNVWKKNPSAFAGRDRVEVCREIATIHAGQLASIANGRA